MRIHLLPVTKIQLEQFLAEPNEFGDQWYEALLKVHRRVSYRHFSANEREYVFVGGILPDEALAFTRWLGEGYRLPTVAEWRALYRQMEQSPIEERAWRRLLKACCPSAKAILKRLRAHLRPSHWLELTLLTGGLVEWVQEDGCYVGLGKPRPAFHPNLWNPLEEVIHPLQPVQRMPYFGFRLVQNLTRQESVD
ncbi:MAG: formylglycine-generating enzyme family protein [Armatimonadetes bacterium]|nr:formylglycine-generating enzyme family protein [Armatimonadota bacterium]